MSFKPTNPPIVSEPDAQAVAQWADEEFRALAVDQSETTALDLRPIFAVPTRPREGMIIYADGTQFDPGFGAGPYVRMGSLWVPLRGRPTISAGRIYFTRTDGNDANTGLVNSAGGAFRTVQHMVDVINGIDRGIFSCTGVIGTGTFSESITLGDSPGSQSITLIGQGAGSVIAPPTASPYCIGKAGGSVVWTISSLKLAPAGTAMGFQATNGATLQVTNIDYGTFNSGFTQNFCLFGGRIVLLPPIVVSGAAAFAFAQCQFQSFVGVGAPGTITMSGNPAYAGAFAVAQNSGSAQNWNGAQFVPGTTSGQRYNVSGNAEIFVGGQGENFLPGATAGVRSDGGVYH